MGKEEHWEITELQPCAFKHYLRIWGMLSLSEANASLSQQYSDGSMAFCQDSCLFQSIPVYDRKDALSCWTRSVPLTESQDSPWWPSNFPKVAMFEEFLGKPTLQSRTGMTGPTIFSRTGRGNVQGWSEATLSTASVSLRFHPMLTSIVCFGTSMGKHLSYCPAELQTHLCFCNNLRTPDALRVEAQLPTALGTGPLCPEDINVFTWDVQHQDISALLCKSPRINVFTW